jgi:Ca2+-binding RTX toxin-like protein
MVDEGESLEYAITFDDFGFSIDNVISYDANFSFGGEAQNGIDYTFVENEGLAALNIRLSAVDDEIVEDRETATITLTGNIEYIGQATFGTGSFHTNINGDRVFGERLSEPVSVVLNVEINSRPVASPRDLVYFGGGSETPFFNVLDYVQDGAAEPLSAVASPINFTGVSGAISENGDVVLSQVDVGGAIDGFTIDYEVQDDGGLSTSASQFIRIARLSLDDLGATIQLIEGEDAPEFHFNLSAPVDQTITVTATLTDPTGASDLGVASGNILPGQTSAALSLLTANTDDILEQTESGTVTLSASAGGSNVPFLFNGVTSSSHDISIELQDRVIAGLEATAVDRGVTAASNLFRVLFEQVDVSLATNLAADHAVVVRQYVGRVGAVAGVAFDATQVYLNYESRMEAAERMTDRDAQTTAMYNALRGMVVDTGSTVAGAAFASGALGGAGFAAGFVSVFVGAATAPAWVAALGTVAVGWAANYAYNEYFKDDVERHLSNVFGNVMSAAAYRRMRDEQEANPLNPDQAVILGTPDDDDLNSSEASEVFFAMAGDDTISGTVETLNSDQIVGFAAGDQLVIAQPGLTAGQITVRQGSLIVEIDVDGDGTLDSVITLAGEFTDALRLSSTDTGVILRLEGDGEVLPTVGGPENMELSGTGDDDTLTGDDGDDIISGLSGNDLLVGNNGHDTLRGDDGNDTLIGGGGDDSLSGGGSPNDLRDIIYGGGGNDSIDGGYGNDELRGDAGNDDIAGGFGADTVIGGAGNDTLTGSAYGDEIFGSDGLDFINGGFGHDRVNGGDGADRFYHLGIADHGSDWIQDYNAADGDVLMWGGAAATAADFQINTADTANAGVDGVSESFVIYRPTGQIMWALVDGNAQSSINIQIAGQTFDLLE